MPENQAPAHSVVSGADDSRPATMGDIRHLESTLRAAMNHMETSLRGEMAQMREEMRGDLREVRNGQWKIITLAIVGLPVMLEVVPMIFDLLRG